MSTIGAVDQLPNSRERWSDSADHKNISWSNYGPLSVRGVRQPHRFSSAHARGVGATAGRQSSAVTTSVSTPLECLACLVPEGGIIIES